MLKAIAEAEAYLKYGEDYHSLISQDVVDILEPINSPPKSIHENTKSNRNTSGSRKRTPHRETSRGSKKPMIKEINRNKLSKRRSESCKRSEKVRLNRSKSDRTQAALHSMNQITSRVPMRQKDSTPMQLRQRSSARGSKKDTRCTKEKVDSIQINSSNSEHKLTSSRNPIPASSIEHPETVRSPSPCFYCSEFFLAFISWSSIISLTG